MILYLITPIIAFASAVLLKNTRMTLNGKDYSREGYLVFSFFIPFVIYAFRDTSIGADTFTYCNDFQNIANRSSLELLINGYSDYEKGFLLLCKAISLFSKSPSILLFATSIIINALYANAIARERSLWFFTTMIYFSLGNYLYNLNIMRQAIAAGIIVNAVICLINKKYFKYSLLVILAASFHTFALVAAFFIPAVLLIKTKKQLVVASIAVAVFVISSLELVHIIVIRYFPHFDYYFRNNYHSDQRFGLTSLAYVIVELLILILILKNYSVYDKNHHKIIVYTFAMVLAASALIMMPRFGIYERIAKFFQPFLIVSIPFAVSGIKNDSIQKCVMFGIMVLCVSYYLYIIATNAFLIVPFMFWNGAL